MSISVNTEEVVFGRYVLFIVFDELVYDLMCLILPVADFLIKVIVYVWLMWECLPKIVLKSLWLRKKYITKQLLVLLFLPQQIDNYNVTVQLSF